MAALLNFWNSPSKRGSAIDTGSDTRGMKRKAKVDPYEDMDDDDDDIIPARKTPTSQRTARSRLSSASATPGSSTRPRQALPASSKRRPGRPSLKSQQGDASDKATAPPKTNAESNLARAKAPDAVRLLPDSLVPEAPMGDLGLLSNSAAGTSAPPATKPPQAEKLNEPLRQERGRAKPAETRPVPNPQGDEAEKQEQEDDDREVREIAKLIKHRTTGHRSSAVEVLVQWVGEDAKDATWEAEEEIQQGAEEMLYEYWDAQGGRTNALFRKPKHPPPEIYFVFKILRHEKKNRGGFQFEVQWVGHSAARADTTMEAENKLKNIAPGLLDAYWESVGGRAGYLAPRGRAKKARAQ
ncbi:hypothetical protein F5Y09DRAFT_321239 [Xylaria sp. FL1042]|nr:hypothetical protein F5Y09DRAFT_321239 [Xylaria sp. FL1042]